MSYTPKYTSEDDIEKLLQFNITKTTHPNSDDVASWIEEIEAEVDAKLLGWGEGRNPGEGYSASDEYFDVPPVTATVTPIERFEYLTKGIDPYWFKRGVLILLKGTKLPIISISSLAKRETTEFTEKPTWTSLIQGFYTGWTEAADSDYLLVKTKGRAGQEHGIALYFYSDNTPNRGKAQLKATYSYGWNLPEKVLKRYCTLRLAVKVANEVVLSGEPVRISSFTGGDFQEFVNTQLDTQIKFWQTEAERLERKFFPRETGARLLRL